MISVLITLAVAGLIVWAIVTYIPMPDIFKRVIIIIAVICLVFYLLNVFGIVGKMHDIPVPKVG